MKLLSFEHRHRPSWGVLDGGHVADLGQTTGTSTLREALGELTTAEIADLAAEPPYQNTGEVRMLPPVPDPGKIFCVGRNYREHVHETTRELPTRPTIFTRFADTLIADGEDLVAPWHNASLDYEGELAVVIGRTGRHIPVGTAAEHVLGYAVFNDASVRDYQRHTSQFTPGKNFPGTGAFGPYIRTVDEVPDLAGLRITTRLNGAVVQESTLDNMIFSVADIVAYCSEWTTLNPGDVIATGTPGGIGAARRPPLWVHPGDVCEVEVESIGRLINPVVGEALPDPTSSDAASLPRIS